MPEHRDGSSNSRSAIRKNTQRSEIRQLKDDFLSLAAHEIRSPITVIKAQAQLAERFLERGKFTGELAQNTLRSFVRESDRLARLCSDLLDVARLDNGCFDVRCAPFDLTAVVGEVLGAYLSHGGKHRFELTAPATICAHGDRDRTRQLLSGLLHNAVRYSPGGGVVAVAVERRHERASVAVSDEGVGIASEALPLLFERYAQAHQSGLRGAAGLGLGLYLARESLRRMGGTIDVASEGLGRGARFSFSLPLASSPVVWGGSIDG